MTKDFTISPVSRLLDMAEVFAAVTPPHQCRQRDRQHHAGQQAAGEQRRDRDAGHRTDRDQHQAGRDGFGLGAGGREQGDQIAGVSRRVFSCRGTARVPPPPCRPFRARYATRPGTSRRPARSAGRRGRGRAGWPERATMARAMPVISINRPRNTNSGTASRIRWLIPSSMRPTSTISGVCVVSARYLNTASPKPKAITPAKTQKPATPTKKITRLTLPSGRSHGCARHGHRISAGPVMKSGPAVRNSLQVSVIAMR